MEDDSLLAQFSSKLIKTLSRESGLQTLVDLGYEALGNPFTITDYSVKVLATTGKTQVTDDPVWNELKINSHFIFQTYSYYVRNSLFKEIARHHSPFYWSDPYCKYRRLIGKIRINNKDVAFMVVCAHNRDFETRDEELVSLLCEAYSIELQKTKHLDYSQALMHQSFLFDLLNGTFEDEGLISERLKILGIKFKSKLFVLSIDIQNLDKSKTTLPFMRDEIENKLAYAKAIVFNQIIVVLASCENDRRFLEVELKPLKEFIAGNKLQAGISRPFQKLADVREHYLDSLEALSLGNLTNADQNFYKYEDYLILDLLNKNSAPHQYRKYIHYALLRLIEYDQENGTDYVRSFYIYLCNFKNIKDSAARLNIHRNTLFHRMEKIEQLLNVDLNDGNVLFQLYLSYKILEFLQIPLP